MLPLTVAHTATTHTSSGNGWLGGLLIVLLIGILVGRRWGRWAGLKHLGKYEFRGRWANVKKVRSW